MDAAVSSTLPGSGAQVALRGPRRSKKPMRGLRLAVPVLAAIPLAGCELVGDIFKAGMWVGVIAVVLVIAIVGAVATRLRS